MFDEEEILTGTVKWYSLEKLYGFIVPDSRSGDIFVHGNTLDKNGIQSLREGDRVRFIIGEHKGRPQAENLQIV